MRVVVGVNGFFFLYSDAVEQMNKENKTCLTRQIGAVRLILFAETVAK
jgi:hypothetical protein